MHNHRLVPEGAKTCLVCPTGNDWGDAYKQTDTIPMPSEWSAAELVVLAGIIPEEWAEICCGCDDPFSFSQYLSDLISLTPLKGLTVEDMKELKP